MQLTESNSMNATRIETEGVIKSSTLQIEMDNVRRLLTEPHRSAHNTVAERYAQSFPIQR